MPIPFNFSCVSDCFKQNGTPITVDIHNEQGLLENNLTAIVNILVPLIEKIVIEYIDKRFPTQNKSKFEQNNIPVESKDENN